MSVFGLAATSALSLICVALAMSDFRRYRLPDRLTLALGLAGLAVAVAMDRTFPGQRLVDGLIGAALGFGVFEVIGLLYRRVRCREGLGMGDSKLMAAAGTWVGWQGLGSVLFIGCLLGLAGTLVMARLRGRPVGAAVRVPLGTYLCAGLWLTWVIGPLGA